MAAQQLRNPDARSGISSCMNLLAKAISRIYRAMNSLPLRQQPETPRVKSRDEALTACLKHAFTCQI